MTSVLHNRAFRRLAALYVADGLFEWVGTVALMALVYRETESAAASAALLICKQVIPGALIPVLGTFLERVSLHRSLFAGLLLQGAALAGLATLDYGAVVFMLATLAGLTGGLVRALLRAGVARSVSADELGPANAALNVFIGVAGLAGPAGAAVSIALFGIGTTLIASAATLVVLAAGVALFVRIASGTEVLDAPTEGPTQATARRDANQVPLAGLLAMVGVIACVFSMDDPALLAFSEQSLHAGVSGYSAIFVAWGAGITLGGLLFTRLTAWPLLRVYSVATVMAAIAYIGMSVSPTIGVACAFAVFGGIGNGMDWVAIVTVVQRAAPKGREVWAATRLEAIATAGPGLGILLGGLLADATSPRLTILVPGVVALIALAAGATLLRTHGRRVHAAPAHSFTPSIHGGSA